jgi:hypothetical protein
MKKHLTLALMFVLITSWVCLAIDWPQYLGPGRNAISTETGIKRSWDNGVPDVLWTFPLGQGFGGPAVNDGKIYVLDRIGNEQDILRCLELATGKEQWTFAYDAPGETDHPGSRSVPTIAHT